MVAPSAGAVRGGRAAVTVLVTVLVGMFLAAPSASAAKVVERRPKVAERRPSPMACVNRNPAIPRLTAQEAAGSTWPEEMLKFSEAWAFSRGAGVTVAVVDSGIDAGHEQLRGRVVPGKDVTGGRVVRGGGDDCAGHGTAVAGLIAAQRLPGRAMTGVAPDAMLLPVRETWGIDDYGHATSGSADALLLAMRVAVDSGAQVVNVSVTVPDVQLTQRQRQAFNDVAQRASDRDVVIVAATGNRSQYTDLRDRQFATYPAQLAAWYSNVIAVSGVTSDGKVDEDSISGAYVTVAAPDRGFPSTMLGGGLVSVGGTSYAAPLVSGLVALVRSRYRDLRAADVKRRIEGTADHPSTDLPNPRVGYGVINPVAAVTSVLPPTGGPAAPSATARPLDVVTDKDAASRRYAMGGAVIAVVLAGLLVLGGNVVRRGRRRGWRPGNLLRPR